jgi:ribosomal protein S18 acetylase RimI-like enzyme
MHSDDRAIDHEGLTISALGCEFADEIAGLHADSLSGDILPALGRGFLTRYYRQVLETDSQSVIGAVSSARLIGFCQVSFSRLSVWAVMKSDPSILAAILKLALVDTRMLVNGILMTQSHPPEVWGAPEIAFIVVRSEYRGRGIGRRMVEVANDMAAARGRPNIITKTANKVARAMYESAFGARVVATRTISRRTYWYMSWTTMPGASNDDVAP